MSNFISLNEYKNIAKGGDFQKLNKLNIATKSVQLSKKDVVELKLKLEEAKKQNGLIEKLADKIKNKTGIGYSSLKIEQAIKGVESGSVTQQDASEEIKNYRRSQENIAQATGNVLSILAASIAFFSLKNNLVKGKSIIELNKEKVLKMFNSFVNSSDRKVISKKLSKFTDVKEQEKLISTALDRKTLNAVAAIGVMCTGGLVKNIALKINRINTKQYKPEIDNQTMSKKEIKAIKKSNKKAKKNANFRNGLTGMINGMLMPIVGLLGPAGVPLYIVLNSLSEYFIGTREDSGNKSIKSYIENLKTSKLTHFFATAIAAVPLVKKGQYSMVLEKNASKVVEELKNATLKPISGGKNTYEELQEILFNDKKIASILNDFDLPGNKIKKLSDANIFAVKFKQIANDGDELSAALKESCPQTWTLDEAQAAVEKTFGAKKYILKKCVGTGTVAQTYVAQDESGKDVCIKLIHQGLNKEKIVKDKEAFISIINSSKKSQQEKDFLIKNIENLSKGIESEVDLQNEMIAAQKLAKTTKMANVVKPIEVKDNIYVMQRADGISLADFNEFGKKFMWADMCKDDKMRAELAQKFKEKIGVDIEFENLTKKETIKMIEQYQNILNEQFSKVDAQGKVIHGDIHPGNIFIDVKKLKEGDKKFFTLIDTGNTIEQTSEQALRFMNLTSYIKNADVDNIAKFVLDGAVLPDGMTQKKAQEIISQELNKVFFGKEVALGIMTNDSLLTLTDNVMKKFDIIPSSTQGNLLKAKKSSKNSLTELYVAYLQKFKQNYGAAFENADNKLAMAAETASMVTELSKDATLLTIKNIIKQMIQERANLVKMPASARLKLKKGANTPKSNSQDALTYKLKQYVFNSIEDIKDMFN